MLSAAVTTDSAALAASLADWWALAGVDVAVQDLPRDWLAKMRPVPLSVVQLPNAAPAPAMVGQTPAKVEEPEPEPDLAAIMPDMLDAFLAWLADMEAQPERAFSSLLVPPQVVASPTLLIVTDMPAVDGELFSPSETALITAMIRAVGLDVRQVAFASLLLARPAGGIAERRIARHAGERLAHFIRLLRPGSLLLLGDATGRALEQAGRSSGNQEQGFVNQAGGTLPIMHLPTPSVLLKHPSRKAAAWNQLRQLAAGR